MQRGVACGGQDGDGVGGGQDRGLLGGALLQPPLDVLRRVGVVGQRGRLLPLSVLPLRNGACDTAARVNVRY